MGCRYYTMVWYGIETISFDFYGMVWETCWYQRYGKLTLTLCVRILVIILAITPLGYRHRYHYHSAPPSLLLSVIAIIITPLSHGSNHSSNHSHPIAATIAIPWQQPFSYLISDHISIRIWYYPPRYRPMVRYGTVWYGISHQIYQTFPTRTSH